MESNDRWPPAGSGDRGATGRTCAAFPSAGTGSHEHCIGEDTEHPQARPPRPEGPARLQAGQWWYNPRTRQFVYSKAPGITILPRFDQDTDCMDLTGRRLDIDALRARMTDRGWATEIDLDGTAGAEEEDRIIVKGRLPPEFAERHFML